MKAWLKRLARRLFIATHRRELEALARRIELELRIRSFADVACGAIDALEDLGLPHQVRRR